MTTIEATLLESQTRETADRYEFMMDTVRLLGKKAWQHINEASIEMQLKPDGTKVTTADIALNNDFIELVERLDPTDLVWGEEKSNSEKGDISAADHAWTWLIDPIDGTNDFWRSYLQQNFSRSTANIMITGFAPGETTPTMSVISNPFNRQRAMVSAVGGKALLHSRHMREPQIVRLQPTPPDLGSVKNFEDGWWKGGVPDLRKLQKLMPYARRLDHPLFMASVALGDVNVSAFAGPSNPHDVAPGAVIVHNAGGAVTTFKKESYGEVDWRTGPISGVVAANNQQLADNLIEEMRAQGLLSSFE